MKSTDQKAVNKFPMGPHIREWLAIPAESYKGDENTSPSASDVANFTDAFLRHLEDATPNNSDHLVDILEELVGMNMPLLAIKLVDAYPNMFPVGDFRAQLHIGNASMLVSDLTRAESAFIEAQRLVPEEPAPYVNLVQIYCHDGLLDKAKKWCDAGLDADADNPRLWELLAWLEQSAEKSGGGDIAAVPQRLAELARSKNSWAGLSLACDLRDPEDIPTKVSALEKFWDEGCRDTNYLVEFTALLGMAGRYDRIPPVIWQVEKQSSNGLPWQLRMHLAQAYLGLGRDDDARIELNKLNNIKDLPEIARQTAQALWTELSGAAAN